MIAPKPEMINQAGKRFKKPTAVTIKSKKRQSESGKQNSVGSVARQSESGKNNSVGSVAGPAIGSQVSSMPASLMVSKRCSTSHFGAVLKSQHSSAHASKESSKRQSLVSSLSKRSPQQPYQTNDNIQSSGTITMIQSDKVFKI